jgi:NhaP-type Na+/H+ and K+/H+ antiporter
VPESLGWLLLLFGGLLLLALFLDDLASRIKLPGFLLVLLLGLLIDNNLNPGPGEAPSLLTLDQADHLAQLALVLVLFFGGITSNWQSMRPVLQPALRLATLGSLLTALILAAVVMGLQNLPLTAADVSLPLALFIGAMFCSTDASAVFAILRPLKRRLPPQLLDLLECESGFNDPIAVVLAGVALAVASGQGAEPSGLLVEVVRSFLLGAFLGFLGGKGAVLLLTRRTASSASLMAVLGLALLMAVIGGSVLLGGSGLLAAYVMGLVLGTSPELDQQALEESQAGFAKLAELLLFLCLGLVVEPTAVVQVLKWALVLLVAVLLVRWLVVSLLMLRSGFSAPERTLVAMAGLRGAVPIAIALQAAATNVPWGPAMPPIALGVVLLGVVGQGLALGPLVRRLGPAS